MLRHPFYIAVCLLGIIYLGYADRRGTSLLNSLGRMSSGGTGRGGYYGGSSFSHK